MSLVKNRTTGNWEGDHRVPGVRRLHLSYRTKVRKQAQPLYEAVHALLRDGDPVVVELLRAGKVTAEQVARCVRDRQPFSSLRPGLTWPTVADAVAAYLAWLGGHAEREASTAENAKYHLAPFVARFADVRLDRVAPAEADAWQQEQAKRLAPNTLRLTVMRVEALYAWHRAQDARAAAADARPVRLLVSPLDPTTRPTATTRRERYLTPDEAARLLAATPGALLGHVGVLLFAGLRIEEMLHLRVGVDVDLGRDMLVVQARGTKGRPGYWKPKTGDKQAGNRREVPVNDALRTMLDQHLRAHAGEAYLFPAAGRGARNPLRPTPTRAEVPMPATTFRTHFDAIVTRAGLTYGRADAAGVVPHTLRHTFASWLVLADVNLFRVAKLMGNSLAIVESTYSHLAPTDNRAAVALLSGAVPLPIFPGAEAPPEAR